MNEIFEIVRNLHVAYMGDNRNEIQKAEIAYKNAQEQFGKDVVANVQKQYNEEVIGVAI